ncbi:hypothetical protein [Listeria booriae]|uniref:hypothetical protein n=1 Tax=Listeria booriae TaxID=1552123 RepID=UPI00162ACC62|nr:hypothetical protein [Listeria booriae]MBC1982791.1 hypothetical protein [Listeria booriae]MBC6163312.1 hypothetical protein [Listeria booriae]
MAEFMCNITGNEEHWDDDTRFPTRDEAEAYAIEQVLRAKRELQRGEKIVTVFETDITDAHSNLDEVRTGEVEEYVSSIDTEHLIDQLRDQAYDFGDEFSEGYLDSVTNEQEAELADALNKALHEWEAKNNHSPKFWLITNIQTHYVPESEEEI